MFSQKGLVEMDFWKAKKEKQQKSKNKDFEDRAFGGTKEKQPLKSQEMACLCQKKNRDDKNHHPPPKEKERLTNLKTLFASSKTAHYFW